MTVPETEQNHKRSTTKLVLHRLDSSCTLICMQTAVFRNVTKTDMQYAECLYWSSVPVAGFFFFKFCEIRLLLVI
jgi:hypothetical protein